MDPGSIKDEQISLFFGTDWVVTIQETRRRRQLRPAAGIDPPGARPGCARLGADYLAYLLVDAVVDAYFPVLDELGDRLHALEAEALTSSSDDTLVRLQWLRHDHWSSCGAAVWPMREAGRPALLRGRVLAGTPPRPASSCATSYDHAGFRRLELVETLREMVGLGHGGLVSRPRTSGLNAVMKVPHRDLHDLHPAHLHRVDLYGMNFKFMPELSSAVGLPGGPRR